MDESGDLSQLDDVMEELELDLVGGIERAEDTTASMSRSLYRSLRLTSNRIFKMPLSDAQKQTLAAAIRAESNSIVVNALSNADGRRDDLIFDYCNTASATDAWRAEASSDNLFRATDVTKFDNISAGKRDAWMLLLTFAPVDFRDLAYRVAVVDVWGLSNSVAVLQACTRKATNAELYLGSSDATANTVTAKALNYSGNITVNEVSDALNRF